MLENQNRIEYDERRSKKKYLPIIQAYIDGKQIQWLDETGRWHDTNDKLLTFYSPPSNYRIKPEPKYRPFKTQEECWEEMHKHPDFGWVKCKYTGNFASIGNISEKKDKKLFITWTTNEGYNFLASDVFNDYTFTDGEPFGIKNEWGL